MTSWAGRFTSGTALLALALGGGALVGAAPACVNPSSAPGFKPVQEDRSDGSVDSGPNGTIDSGPNDAATAVDGSAPDANLPLDPDAQADAATVEIAPAAFCDVDGMDVLYPGFLPPNPYGDWAAADVCLAGAHDVIIVLGCPNEENGDPALCQQKRVDLAIDFWTAGYASRFITTGAAVHTPYVEADTLRDLLVQSGVPASAIWTDPLAEHTDENLYYSSVIMQDENWASAIVISDDPGHLLMTAVCDSNCCVELGRLTVAEFPVLGKSLKAGHYALYPWAALTTQAECDLIEMPTKFMCINLSERRACKDDFQL